MELIQVGRRTISNCRYIFLFLLFLLFSISLTIVTKGREMWLVIEATDVISVTHKPPGGGWRVRGNNGPFDTLRREFSTDSLITILRSCLEYRDKLESFPWEEASKNLSRPSNSSISLERDIISLLGNAKFPIGEFRYFPRFSSRKIELSLYCYDDIEWIE